MSFIKHNKSSKNKNGKPAILIIITHENDKVQLYPLNKETLYFGRDESSDIRVNSQIVGRKHGMFILNDKDQFYYYADLNSTNGTIINGKLIKQSKEQGINAFKLSDFDVISINSSINDKFSNEAVTMIFTTNVSIFEEWKAFNISFYDEISIGRNIDNNIVLNNSAVSRKHAILKSERNKWVLYDNGSSNGVSVNNEKIVNKIVLNNYDIIKIVDTTIMYLNNRLIYNIARNSEKDIHINIIEKLIHKDGSLIKKRKVLSNINLDIKSGEFILVLTGFGVDKNALINIMRGLDKVNGNILLGDKNLYKNLDILKYKIGFVPENSFDALNMNEFTDDFILNSSKERFSKGTSIDEIRNEVIKTMKFLDITNYRNQEIKNLNNFQQKNVSLAIECVSNPYILLLDEPISNLDFSTGKDFLRNLSMLSKNDKTVMVFSNFIENTQDLFTKVIVLANSNKDNVGHLVFYGSVCNALQFFEVKCLKDIINKINPKENNGQGLSDDFIDKFEINRNKYI